MPIGKPRRNPNEWINISVPRELYNSIKTFLDEGIGGSIWRVYHRGALNEFQIMKQRNSPSSLLSSSVLLRNGWKKEGSSAYKRDNDVIFFDGIHWFLNGSQLTVNNYIEEVFKKDVAKFNPKLPTKNAK